MMTVFTSVCEPNEYLLKGGMKLIKPKKPKIIRYGTAVYIKNDFNCTEIPYRFNVNNVEITVTVLSHPVPNIHVVGIYRSKTLRISELIEALTHLHKSVLTELQFLLYYLEISTLT